MPASPALDAKRRAIRITRNHREYIGLCSLLALTAALVVSGVLFAHERDARYAQQIESSYD